MNTQSHEQIIFKLETDLFWGKSTIFIIIKL